MLRTPESIAARYREIEAKLLAFQRPHTKSLIRSLWRSRDALDASDTGTGKTFCALAVAYALNVRALIVCPKSVISVWRKIAESMGVEGVQVTNYEAIRTGRTQRGEWEGRHFRWQLDNEDWMIVFDECHRLKNWRSLQCDLGISAIKQGFRVMGLSATAADNPMHMRFVAYLTRQITNPDAFFGWMLRHGVKKIQPKQKSPWDKKQRAHLMFFGDRRAMTEIHHAIFPRHGSRMRIAEIPDFPKTVLYSEAYDMDEADEIQRVYEEMREEIAVLRARMASDTQANILTAQLRARQRTELLKVPTLEQMAQDALDEGNSVVIFVNFDATLRALSARLGTLCVIHGGQRPEVRNRIIDRFQRDKEHVVICNIKAGGVGIGLHGKRNRVVFICPTFSPFDFKQAIGRVPRAGGGDSVQYVVWAAGTVEEEANTKMKAKLNNINTLNDAELAEVLSF